MENSDLEVSDSGEDEFDMKRATEVECPDWPAFDPRELMSSYVKYLPLHSIMTREYRSFIERFLVDIITGHSRSQVMNQFAGTEHKYYYKNLRVAPPIFRQRGKGLFVDSYSQAFKRKSTLSCIVMADVYHETRVFQDCLDLEDVYNQHKRNYKGTGWRAIKGRVKSGKLWPQGEKAICPPVLLPKAVAAKFKDTAVVIICEYPNVRTWGQCFKFKAEDVFEQATRKPYPEYDQRLLLHKTLTVNSQVPLFDLPLLMGVFAGVPHFCSKEEERSPVTASFVVNGLPKSIFMQFRLIPNVCFVFKVVGKESNKYRYNCEIRSLGDKTKWKSTSTLYIYLQLNADRIFLHVPCFATRTNTMLDVPLLHALKMLGIDDREQLVQYLYPAHIDIDESVRVFLDGVVSEMNFTVPAESVRQFYAAKLNKTPESVQSTFDYSFLSHCDYGDRNESKLQFFAACLRKLAAVDLGIEDVDDRDHIANKQVQCAGQLLAVLKRQLWRNYNVEQSSTLSTNMQQQKVIDINAMLATRSKPTSRLMHHFHSGQWSVYNNSKQGYLQLKTDTNDVACYEQLGRVSKPVKRDVRSEKPRYCPPSALRHLCASATPDGAPTGLVNNIAINCRISGGVDVDLVAKIVHGFGFFDERAVSLQPRQSRPGTDSSVADAALKQADRGLSESRGSGAQLRSLVRGSSSSSSGADRPPYHLTVYINGNAVGCLRPEISKDHFISYFRACRRRRVIPRDVSIHFDKTMPGIMIRCDIGRMMTVVLIVSELKRVAAVVNMCRQLGANVVQELFVQGCIEYVDCFETETSVVALDPKDVRKKPKGTYDYCAFDSTCIFGLSASLIPSANRNQAPRVSYHAAGQTKGALQETKDVDNARNLAPTHVMSICNAQNPSFATEYERLMRTNDSCGNGYNFNVVVSAKGYNQEDSVIGNRGAYEMGLQMREEYVQVTVRTSVNNSTVYMKPPLSASHRKMSIKPRTSTDHRSSMGCVYRVPRRGALDEGDGGAFDPFDYVDFESEEEKKARAQKKTKAKYDCFHAIQRNGFPRKGAMIEPGDVILGRVNKEFEVDEATGEKTLRFCCASVVSTKRGVVADIVQNTNKDQHVIVFRLHTVHTPDVGDKITSRSGQKGTIGSIEPSWDLMFSRDGIVPNIVMNPHAFPSRMTLAHVLETLAGKLAAKLGLPTIDGTSFSSDITMESVGRALDELGYAPGGEEEYYCGKTGRRLKGQLFSGMVFYKVLKQLSGKKRHTRGAKGPLVNDTRQPTDGKKREGGLRLGEMDRDCIFGHGAAHLYQNLTNFNSDAAVVWYCRSCGHQTNPPGESDNWATHRCSHPNCQSDNVVYLYTTWSHNVLFHEFRALNIKVTYDILRSIASDQRVYNRQREVIEGDMESEDEASGLEEVEEEEEEEESEGEEGEEEESEGDMSEGEESGRSIPGTGGALCCEKDYGTEDEEEGGSSEACDENSDSD